MDNTDKLKGSENSDMGRLVGILVLILLLLIFTRVTVEIDFYHGNDNDHLKIKFFAWFRLIRYTVDVPIVKIDKDSKALVLKQELKPGQTEKPKKEKKQRITPATIIKNLKNVKEVLVHIVDFHRILSNFLKKIQIKKLIWHTSVGIGDASYTGVLTGIIWSLKGTILGLISKYMRLRVQPNIMVTPQFQQMISSMSFQCMIQFWVGHALLVGIKMLAFWRGGMPKFQTTPSAKAAKSSTDKLLS
ncbi:DUF2953 domain-containing protein [Bacillus litorisediminis]|uniref:DUF2953 domain-containing protein n=1 Tax=Bacillus litorisediminis TaxID=2922713 RepID=UPI001FACD591|nr:DUF2953 domain-containing protein [Bacillus litorisediminis]